MRGFISVGAALFMLYVIAVFALGLSVYAVLQTNHVEIPQEPVTRIMIINPSPVPAVSVSSFPTVKITSPSAIKAK